jgi:hypothetical protein
MKDHLFGLNLVLWPQPGARLSLTAESAAFFVGDVPGLPEVPPDYSERGQVDINGQTARWGSSFEPTHAVYLDLEPTADGDG